MTDQQMFRGYGMKLPFLGVWCLLTDMQFRFPPIVTSSQNFVGRMKGPVKGSESSCWEGAFSLSKRLAEAL